MSIRKLNKGERDVIARRMAKNIEAKNLENFKSNAKRKPQYEALLKFMKAKELMEKKHQEASKVLNESIESFNDSLEKDNANFKIGLEYNHRAGERSENISFKSLERHAYHWRCDLESEIADDILIMSIEVDTIDELNAAIGKKYLL